MLLEDVTLLSIAGSPDVRFAALIQLGRSNGGEQPVRIPR
jgi:hypothetical protein